MRATFCALEPEGNRYRFPSVRGHGPLLQKKARRESGLSFLRLGESSHNRVPSTSDVLEADGCSVGCRLEY